MVGNWSTCSPALGARSLVETGILMGIARPTRPRRKGRPTFVPLAKGPFN